MKIAFDLTPLYDHLTGIERYNLNIAKSIIEQHPEAEYILLFKNEVPKKFESIIRQNNVTYKILPAGNKLFFIQWRLFRALNNIAADYYLFLSFTSPVLFKKERIINAIHDLTCWDFPESIPTKMKWYYRYTYHVAIKRSWKIVTVSQFSQKQICQRYHLSKTHVPVIYDGLTDIFKNDFSRNSNLKKKYGLPNQYLLSLSTLEPRKNLQLLLKAYTELIESGTNLPDLVLAGRQGWKLEDVVGSNISNIVKSRVHFTGFIDDEDLPQLYRDADLFIFPSKYEGFGLPVIEAMSQGTLVLSSDAASLPEVINGNGMTFKSQDIKSLKGKILEFLQLSSDKKSELCHNAKNRALSYNWDTEANKLFSIMKKGL